VYSPKTLKALPTLMVFAVILALVSLLRPYLRALLGAFVFSVLLMPLQDWLEKRIKSKRLSAVFSIMALGLFITVSGLFLVF